MAQQQVGFGAAANDGTGDNLRTGAQKINANFTELYGTIGHVSLPYASIINSNAGLYRSFVIAPLTGNVTLANPTNLVAGMALTWRFQQDSVGGRTLQVGNLFKFSYGTLPSLTTAPNSKDLLSAYYDGVDLLAIFSPDHR